MSIKQFQGGVVTKNPTEPTTSVAKGIWTVGAAENYTRQGLWPRSPGAPTIGTATQASSTSISVPFTTPGCLGTGGATYKAISSPGGVIAQGASSPLVVTGLTTGTAYTFKAYGVSPGGTGPESAQSNSITPQVVGQQAYTTPGTYSWVAPAGVTSVSAVAVGGGNSRGSSGAAGGGGALAYVNTYSVTPGNSYAVTVACVGGNSSFTTASVAEGGKSSTNFTGGSGGNVLAGTNGGSGGSGGNAPLGCNSFPGGGGAGGYSGAGGTGGAGTNTTSNGAAGSGGGAGGGGGGSNGTSPTGGAGGGVGLFGQGASGASSSPSNNLGKGGSGGANATDTNPGGGLYGGGGTYFRGPAGGAVRIIWPGTTRVFPSTCTGDL